ncbi:MAG TPA: glycosyltransferase family 1 protein [Thermodesulfovibrionales bacterium]|nr:glycosyltransferase family 1 protein [Thermodesulfovibrionales bacterium]
MKIGINATFLNENPTGVGVYTKETSSRIHKLNRETFVFSSVPCNPIGPQYLVKTPTTIRGSLHLLNNLLRFLYINTLLPLKVTNRGIDVLLCPIAEFPFFQVPQVITIHDLHPIYFPQQFGLSSRYFRLSLKMLPRIPGRIVVPSFFVKSELLKVAPIDSSIVDVIPNGYNSELFKPQKIEMRDGFMTRYGLKKPYILFVGSLFPYKNVKTLIETFMGIKNQISHSLVVVGNKRLSTEPLAEDKRILYMDYIPLEDIPKFYSYADMLVHPSLAEGFGMTVLEAMACGTPVISSRNGSLPEVVGEAGILFDPYGNSLEQAMLALIRNKDLRNDLIEKGLRNVTRYSWDTTAERILQSCKKAFQKKLA